MAAPAMVARQRRSSGWGCRCSTTSATRRATWPPCSSSRSTPEPGVVGLTDPPGEGPRLQDLVTDDPLERHRARRLRLLGRRRRRRRDALAAALEQANAAATPTARLTQVEAAYWTDVGTKEHLRWVMPEPEDAAARRAGPAARRGPGRDRATAPGWSGCSAPTACSRPVWDLPLGTGPEALEDPAVDVRRRTSRRRWPTTRRSPPTSAPPAPGWPTGRSRSAEPQRLAVLRPSQHPRLQPRVALDRGTPHPPEREAARARARRRVLGSIRCRRSAPRARRGR